MTPAFDGSVEMHAADVRASARAYAPDHYITALLAPVAVRNDLVTLAAFWGETGRIALSVGDPLLGEIRLQWWADTLVAPAPASGHPVADAFRRVMARHGLPLDDVQRLIDARRHELASLPFTTESDFAAYLRTTDGTMFRFAALIRGDAAGSGGDAIEAAAQAYGRVRTALNLPYYAAAERLPLWPEAVGSASAMYDRGATATMGRHAVTRLADGARCARKDLIVALMGHSRALIDAMLPVALLEPYLRALEHLQDPMRDLAEIAPLTRVLRLSWAHMRGRL